MCTFHRDSNKIPRQETNHLQCTHKCHKITIPKMADTSKDELLLGGGIRHLTAISQYHAHRKQVPASASNIV